MRTTRNYNFRPSPKEATGIQQIKDRIAREGGSFNRYIIEAIFEKEKRDIEGEHVKYRPYRKKIDPEKSPSAGLPRKHIQVPSPVVDYIDSIIATKKAATSADALMWMASYARFGYLIDRHMRPQLEEFARRLKKEVAISHTQIMLFCQKNFISETEFDELSVTCGMVLSRKNKNRSPFVPMTTWLPKGPLETTAGP